MDVDKLAVGSILYGIYIRRTKFTLCSLDLTRAAQSSSLTSYHFLAVSRSSIGALHGVYPFLLQCFSGIAPPPLHLLLLPRYHHPPVAPSWVLDRLKQCIGLYIQDAKARTGTRVGGRCRGCGGIAVTQVERVAHPGNSPRVKPSGGESPPECKGK